MSFDGDKNDYWTITHSILTQSAGIAGPAFGVNVAGVKESGISISISWQDTVMKTELMEDVVQALHSWFAEITESSVKFGQIQ